MSEDPKMLVPGVAERGAQGDFRPDETRELGVGLEPEMDGYEYLRHALSHELRAPLRAIRAFSDILERRYADALDEKGRDFLGRIVAAGERGEALLDDLVAYTRERCEPISSGVEPVGGEPSEVPRGAQRAEERLRQVRALRAQGATANVAQSEAAEPADDRSMRRRGR